MSVDRLGRCRAAGAASAAGCATSFESSELATGSPETASTPSARPSMRLPPDAKGEKCTSLSPTSSSLAKLPRPPQRP
eukprot:15385440-Alexandrium_andersonii.AAC.1